MASSFYSTILGVLMFYVVLRSCAVVCEEESIRHQETRPRQRRGTCSSGWTDVSGVCVQYVDTPLSWWNAHLDCVQRGGHLSTKDNLYAPLNVIACPSGSSAINNGTDCYELTSITGTFHQARQYCKAKGGDVPDVESEEETQTILGEVSNLAIAIKSGDDWTSGFWIGQNKLGGAWDNLQHSMSGGGGPYLDWAPNQPSGASSENCAVLIYDDVNAPSGNVGKMFSTDCDSERNKIMCKYKAGAWIGAAWVTVDVKFLDGILLSAFDGESATDKCVLEGEDGDFDVDNCTSLHPYVCRQGSVPTLSNTVVNTVVSRVAEATVACPANSAPAKAVFSDETYKCYWFTTQTSWQGAIDECADIDNATLAVIDSTIESNFVFNKMVEKEPSASFAWIGLTYDDADWFDVNGDVVTYTNWGDDSAPSTSSCAVIDKAKSGQWNFQSCATPFFPGICELEIDVPTTTNAEETTINNGGMSHVTSNDTAGSYLEVQIGNIRHAVVTDNRPKDHQSVSALLEELISLLVTSTSDLTSSSIDNLMDITTAVSGISAKYQDTVQDVLDISDIILSEGNKRSLATENSPDTFAHFLQTMDTFTSYVASGSAVQDDVIALDNLDLHARYSVKPGKDEFYIQVKGEDYRSGFSVPRNAFDERLGNVAILVYKTLHQVAPDDITAADVSSDDVRFNSHIYAVSFVLEDDKRANFTNDLISFYFEKIEDLTLEQSCSFWRNDLRAWSSEGCWQDHDATNLTHTVCRCNHLTNFAILMQYTEIVDLGIHEDILEYMTYIGVSLSILCLIITLLIYLVGKLLKSQRIIIHANLAMSLLAAQLIFIGGVDATYNSAICTTIAFMLHYFFLAAFTWMLIEGIHLYMKSTMIFGKEIKTWIFFLLGWGLPIVIVGITFAIRHDGYGRKGSGNCWLSTDNGLSWAFIGPILAIIFANTVVLILVIRVFMTLKANADKTEIQRVKTGIRAILMLQPLLGLSWLFGVFGMDANTVLFQYLFVICNSLQGVFIFICHCVTNEEVRSIFLRRYKKMASTVNTTSSGTSSSAVTETSQTTPKGQGSISSKKAWI
ncbi:adhesion G protein-coupled receptor L4-like isoform X2 [Ptychodera flava]|uniref:adhesion G protein-coupled receptor L4-like isoform X2 n=1 Tax=Ptychodera flava TaxID=63121 RepID=UPI003969DB1F